MKHVIQSLFVVLLAAAPAAAAAGFACLPKGRSLDEATAFKSAPDGKRVKITVGEKLGELKARCRKGRLVDGKGRAIRFYRAQVFGAPTSYALESMKRQRAELAALRRRYAVIEIPADQNGGPTP